MDELPTGSPTTGPRMLTQTGGSHLRLSVSSTSRPSARISLGGHPGTTLGLPTRCDPQARTRVRQESRIKSQGLAIFCRRAQRTGVG